MGFCRVDSTCTTEPGPGRVQYGYDGEGRRVRHQAQAYSGGSWNTTATTLYVYDAAGRLAAEYGIAPQNPPCITCYVTTDPLGDTSPLTGWRLEARR